MMHATGIMASGSRLKPGWSLRHASALSTKVQALRPKFPQPTPLMEANASEDPDPGREIGRIRG